MNLRHTLVFAATALAFLAGCQSPPAKTSAASQPTSEPQPLTGEIFSLKDVDVAPKSRGIQPMPEYPINMRRAGMEGEAIVRFTVDTQGHPRNIEIVSCTHREFGAAAVAAVGTWWYHPAKKNGDPVNCQMTSPPLVFSVSDVSR